MDISMKGSDIMAKEKVHRVTTEELSKLMNEKSFTREEAEFWFIDHYDEVIFPDENDNINDTLKEQRKVAHVYDKKKGKRKVERKPDEDKRELIKIIADAFANCEIVNPERQIDLNYLGNHYSITLTKHRLPKEK
jgi:hypothetical protein